MDSKENKKSNKKKHLLTAIIVILAIAGITFGIFQYMNYSKEKEEKTLAYTDLITKIKEDSVEKIEMKEKSTTVKVKLKDQDEEKEVKVPESEAFIEFVQDQVKEGKTINLNQKEENLLVVVGEKLLSFLPTIMLIVLLVMIMQMQGLGDKGKVYDATTQKTKTTFKDIAGLDEEKQEMIEIVDFLKKPKKFQEMGAKIPRGVLLCGNPGTGKTLIAKAIAGEADVPFISMSGSEFIEMFAGLGASRVRKLFEKARNLIRTRKLLFADQDAIFWSTTKKKLLPRKFNEQSKFNRKDTVVCHFCKRLLLKPYPHTENFKQWNVEEVHNILKCHAFDEDLEEYLKLKDKFESNLREEV